MNRRRFPKYYYYHPESDTLWSSNLPPDKEWTDGCVEPISKIQAYKLMIQLGNKRITTYKHFKK